TLTQNPSWLSIDYATHVVSGTAPTVSTPTSYTVQVQVDDGKGGACIQTYTVVVEPIVNRPPSITSTPKFTAIVGTNYQYTVTAGTVYRYDAVATATDGDAITSQLGGTPPSGLAIDPVTGRITWPTTTAQAGQNFPITVRAIDSFGAASADRNFTLAVQGDTE